MRIILGIDPGVNGGIVLKQGRDLYAWKMPESDEAIVQLLSILLLPTPDAIYVEQIPKWVGGNWAAGKKVTGSSMATLYGNYKLMVGALLAKGSGPVLHLLTPQKWQKALGLARTPEMGKASSSAWKAHLKARATELARDSTTDLRVTLWNADAVLIALAGEKIFAS